MSKKILIIDDEELVVKSLDKLLRKQGYIPMVCRSGDEALKILKTEAVDLIVSDIRMPSMSGVETIKKIRELLKQEKRPPVKEILITGYAEDETNKEAEALKVSDYIYKPFDLRDFLQAVNKNLNEG